MQKSATDNPVTMKLTQRQAEVLRLLSEGKTSQEVADTLFVTRRTVDFHLVNIYAKLGVRNRMQAFREAVRRGLIQRIDLSI